MKIFAFLIVCAAFLFGLDPCHAAERLDARMKRRKARKEPRKSQQKVVEARNIGAMARDERRLTRDTEGKAGRVNDQKPAPSRLDYNLAKRMREVFKLAKEKLGKQKDLLAQTEAAERKARAEERSRMAQYRQRKKRKINLTVILDW